MLYLIIVHQQGVEIVQSPEEGRIDFLDVVVPQIPEIIINRMVTCGHELK